MDRVYGTILCAGNIWCLEWETTRSGIGGVFAQRGHSANYYGDYPGNNPENHAPAESCTINSKLKNSNI